MDPTEGIWCQDLIDVVIDRAYEESTNNTGYIEDMMSIVGSAIYDDQKADIFEKYLSERSLVRIRHELQDIYEEGDLALKAADSFYDDVFIIGYDGSNHYLSKNEWEDFKNIVLSNIIFDKVVVFSNIAGEILKIRTAQVISQELFESPYDGISGENWLLENNPIPARHRTSVLKRAGIIGPELENQIDEAIEFRNDVIHELDMRHQIIPPSRLIAHVDTTMDTIEELDSILAIPSLVADVDDPFFYNIHGINKSELGELILEEEPDSLEDAVELLKDEFIKKAYEDPNSFASVRLERALQNDNQFPEIFEEYYQQVIKDLDDEEAWSELYKLALKAEKEFGVNLFRRIKQFESRFANRLPDPIFEEEIIQRFDPE